MDDRAAMDDCDVNDPQRKSGCESRCDAQPNPDRYDALC